MVFLPAVPGEDRTGVPPPRTVAPGARGAAGAIVAKIKTDLT